MANTLFAGLGSVSFGAYGFDYALEPERVANTPISGLDLNKLHEFYRSEIFNRFIRNMDKYVICLLYTSPSPRDKRQSRMPSSA